MNNQQNKQATTVDINSFRLLSIIGEGAYAKVLLVRYSKDDKVMALKVIKKEKIKTDKQQERLLDERHIFSETDHQFVPKLYYAFQDSKKIYFALEYCPGGELFNLLQAKSKISEEHSKFYAAQMILAIEHLHSKNIVYRDLKPENVLIDKDGYIKLTDFGLSKRGIKGDQDAKSLCGTPEYLAPEVIKSNGYGKAVDFWCLGSILYEMIVGYPPYYGENKATLFETILNDDPELLPSFTPSLKYLLTGLFQKDPSTRLGVKSIDEIKKHQWFAGFDWDLLIKKELPPPFKPNIRGDMDLQYFCTDFTDQPIESYSKSSKSFDTYPDFNFQIKDNTPNTPDQPQNDMKGKPKKIDEEEEEETEIEENM